MKPAPPNPAARIEGPSAPLELSRRERFLVLGALVLFSGYRLDGREIRYEAFALMDKIKEGTDL